MMREFRSIDIAQEVAIITPTLIRVVAKQGWAITHANEKLEFENDVMFFPNKKCLDNYICVKKIQLEMED